MTEQIFGLYRIGSSGSSKNGRAREIPSSIFDSKEKHALKICDQVSIYSSSKGTKCYQSGGVHIFILGTITGFLTPIPADYSMSRMEAAAFLYRKDGPAFAKNMNGHFVIVVWDERINRLLLVQDKFPGMKTLYWFVRGGLLYFSNYLKPILRLEPEATRQINKTALYHYLKYSYISAPLTIYKDVFQLSSGELLKAENSGIETHTYDPFIFSRDRITDGREAVDAFQDLLTKSISRFYSADTSCGFFLSGGYDSSLNAALAVNGVSEKITTFGISAGEYNADAPYAREVSRLLKTTHYEYRFDGSEINELPGLAWMMENPYYEPGLMLSHAVTRLGADYVKTLIGGEAADQVFGACAPSAYARYRICKNSLGLFNPFESYVKFLCRNRVTEGSSRFKKLEHKIVGRFDVNNWGSAYGFKDWDIKEMLRENIRFEDKLNTTSLPDRVLGELLDYACTRAEMPYALYGILPVYGRMCDRYGVNVFSPYLDRNVSDFVFSLDHSLRTPQLEQYRGGFDTKFLVKELACRWLPKEIFNRPKQGGAVDPLIHIKNTHRLEAVKKTLLGSEFIKDLFHVKQVEKHIERAMISSDVTKVFLLLTLELWHSLFFKSRDIAEPLFTLDEYLEGGAGMSVK